MYAFYKCLFNKLELELELELQQAMHAARAGRHDGLHIT